MTAATDAIRSAIEAAVPARYRPFTRWSGPREREWSWHFDAIGGGVRLLGKIPRWEGIDTLDAALAAGPQPDTQGEFAVLEAISQTIAATGEPGLAAVVPVAYVPSVNAIVAEWLDAVPLQDRVGPMASSAETAELLTRTGRWLRIYHGAFGGWMTEPFDGAAAAASWQLEAVAGDLAGGLGRAVMEVTAAAERLDGHPIATGTIHGDFTLSNVLVTGDDRIAVIDPNRYRGSAMADPARLAVDLMFGRTRLATAGTVPGEGRVHRRVAAVMRGYGDHDETAFGYESAAASLRKWLDLERHGLGSWQRLALVAGRRMFRTEIARLVH